MMWKKTNEKLSSYVISGNDLQEVATVYTYTAMSVYDNFNNDE